jgi:hypothetical protein
MEIATQIFEAWHTGENTGNYAIFKTYVTNAFTLFSHPLMGRFTGETALTKISTLISNRETVRNNLSFSNVIMFKNESACCFQFNATGMVQNNAFAYAGFNIIMLHINKNTLTGFQEYFGYIDANWFNN